MSNRKVILTLALLLGSALTYFIAQQETPFMYSGIVVPHHDMVRTARLAFFAEVAKVNNPKTIVLVSPDHFDTSKTPITISTRVWKLNSGELSPDLVLIDKLDVDTDQADFINEHGITTVIGDINNYFPNADIIPVMISTRAKESEISSFIESLYLNCRDCLVVASVDFSHSLQVDVASLHDVTTLRSLYQLDGQALYSRAEVDSPGTLLALTLWADEHQTYNFDLFSHTNSGRLNKTLVGEMTTHIIGGYKKGEKVIDLDNDLTLMFGGDVMFARGVDEMYTYDKTQALIKDLGDRTFWGVDLSLINLEGVFSNEADIESGWYEYPPVFRFNPKYVAALKRAKIDVVGLANNHNQDGKSGEYEETKNVLNSSGILTLESTNKTKEPIIKLVGDTKVAIFGHSLFEESDDLTPLINDYTSRGYKVIVFIHYGLEYDTVQTDVQTQISRRFIDAGAKLVVGSHPHVLQPVDIYKGVPIVYSLGNFLFDQEQNGAEYGALLGAKFNNEGLTLSLIPINSYIVPKFIDYDLSSISVKWEDNKIINNKNSYFFSYK